MTRLHQPPVLSEKEVARLAALHRYAVLDTLPETAFDRIVRLAAKLFGVPIALISFVDADRQWFKAKVGTTLDQTPRAIAFCNAAIEGQGICQVPDASQDPRFAANPMVMEEPHLRFYAGAPLLTPDGHALGTLCVLDSAPRPPLRPSQAQALEDLAAVVMAQLELRHQLADRDTRMCRAALHEKLLRGVAETPTFHAAIDAAMTALREDTDGQLCLFFRLAPDGDNLYLLAAQGEGACSEPPFLAELRALRMTMQDTVTGQAIREDRQILFADPSPALLARLPAAALFARHGVTDMILTPVSVGTERYCITLCYGPGRQDMPAMAERLRDAAGTLRPLLRRLRDSEETELFRRVVDASNEPVVISEVQPDGDHGLGISYVNPAFLRQTGYRAEEVMGRSPAMLTHEEAKPEAHQAICASVRLGQPMRQEIRNRRRDGSAYWVEINIAPVVDRTGWRTHWVSILHDITERLELEQKLRQAQRLEAIGQLTGGVAHDFNNLLTVILGNAEMLAESLPDDPDLRQMAEMNVAAAERGAALTSRLLAFSRQQALDPKATDVNQVLADLQQMLRRTLGEHIEIGIAGAPDLWPALIDRSQLEHALLNLCINARDAMPAGGKLLIETSNVHLDSAYARSEAEVAPGAYVMIAVSDSGEGMTPEVLARAFEPFFTTREVGKGSGLGLSMVFGFMKQSGGHVKIYSEPGLGTVVKMYLPRVDNPRARVASGGEGQMPFGGGENLLAVEDDPLVREHVAGQLRELGYRVTVAANAAEALALLRQQGDFDLLFTDVVMPGGMHGPALAQEARRIRPGLRVLFTSGYTQQGIVNHGRLEPGVLLLNKPYRRRDLAEKIRQALGALTPATGAPPPAAPVG